MLRINQFAKDLGVTNHDVIEALEKRLGISGKSHSSNLTDDQISQLRRVFDAKSKGMEDGTPLALHKPSVPVRIVKAAAPVEPAGQVPPPAPVLVKGPEPAEEAAKPASEAPREAAPRPSVPSEPVPAPSQPAPALSRPAAVPARVQEVPADSRPAPAKIEQKPPVPSKSEFSRLRVSVTPAPTPKPQEPARYIQLPQQAPFRGRPEAGARPVVQRPGQVQPSVQRPGQPQQNVQRSGQPQPERTTLPMATNTGKGEVRHDQGTSASQQGSRRPYIPPSISSLQPEQGFTRIKMADTPTPTPRSTEPARYIQLPQARPAGGQRPGQRPGPGGRPGGPGARPGGPGGRPGGPRPGGPGARPGGPGRPGMGGRGPALPAAGPIDPNAQKGPGRGVHFAGKKKDDKRTRAEREAEALELKLRQPRSRAQQVATEYIEDEIGIVMLSEGVTVKELAEKCNRPAKDVVAKLLHRGVFATINQPLDTELAKDIAREFGYLADIVSFEEDVQMAMEEAGEVQGDKLSRPPVVTIMGHVDHGKTSLLDAIRHTKVAAGEAGGITQAIGAHHVDLKDPEGNDRQIVFIDTPGHEAFTKMRARGAKVTDIVILVVAADDGVMPQTIEAINHTKAADVPMVVAINKIDKGGANPERVQQMLLQYGVQTEAFGGDVPAVAVSAKTKQGLDELLETVLLVADLKDLKSVYDCPASGSILEAKLDRGRGPVAAVLVQQGTLKAGEVFVAGATMGRVRAMFNDTGEKIAEATPSMAVQILGFEEVPVSGDNFQVVEDEAKGRAIVGFRQEKARAAAQIKQRVTLENLFSTLKDGQIKELPLIVKADTSGSVESLVGSLEKLSTDKVRVRIIHAAAGTVNKNDVLLAEASNASIIAFSTKAEREAEDLAQEEGVDLRFHEIIYKVTEEITAAMVGLLDAVEKETLQGQAEVRQLFKVNKAMIAGSFVTEGKVQKAYRVRVKRGEAVVWDGLIKSLKRFKDDVHEVKNGLDCGISLEGFDDLKEGDVLEFYTREKFAATSL
ncbi:MAG TPA: translation initiation factor IF-2 [Holophaga sp.]|nr:translation initiation factor IF-2 [Holophaga sp.]HPS67562.1 translation initiation factor IF-2 [Holophaga sp.]